jgi:hypothetical protein
MVLIPKEPKPCTIREVIEDAFTYVTNPRFYDSCGKNLEVKTLVLICIGSWFIERMIPQTSVPVAGVGRFAPILPIRGPSESGKNRLANLLRFVSYHPYFDLSKTAVPSLFRPLDIWKGTLIMDEADIKNSGATSQLIQFLNSRAYGTPISRQNPEKISVSHVFQSFGLTIVTQRQHFDDNATESRSVPYYSEKTTTKLPTIEENEVVEQGLNLQDKLLYLRLTLWKTVTVDKAKWHQELSDHRLNSALLTVFALAEHEPWIMTIIDQTVKSIERAKRRRKAVSIDGQLINYLWGKLNESLWDTRDGNYYILNEIQTYADNEENTNETKTPLIATNIKDELGLGYKTIRKVWDSVNISPDDVPDRIRVGTRTYRVFWFKPDRLEKMLREFVLDYEYYNLYELIGLPKPEPVTDVTDVTGSREGGNLTSCIVGEDAVAKQTLPCISSDALNQHQLGEWVHAVEAKEADNIDRDNSLSPDLSQVSHLSQNMPSNEQTAKSVPVSESVENSHLSLKDPWSYTCCICNNEIQLDEGFKPYNIGKEKLWAHMDCLKEHPEGNKQ